MKKAYAFVLGFAVLLQTPTADAGLPRPYIIAPRAPTARPRPIVEQLSHLPEELSSKLDARHWMVARQGATPSALAHAVKSPPPVGKTIADHTGMWSRHEVNHAQEASREAKRMLSRVIDLGWEEPIDPSLNELTETATELIASFHDAFMSDPYGRAEHRPRGGQEVFHPAHDEGFRILARREQFGKRIQAAFGLTEDETARVIKEATSLCAIHDVRVGIDTIRSPARLREFMRDQMAQEHVPGGADNVRRHYANDYRSRAYEWLTYLDYPSDHPDPRVRSRAQIARALRAAAFALRTGDGFRDRGALMKGHDDGDFMLRNDGGRLTAVLQIHDYATGRRHFAERPGDLFPLGEVHVKDLELDDAGNLVVSLTKTSLRGVDAEAVAKAIGFPVVDSVIDLQETYPGARKTGIIIRTEGMGQQDLARSVAQHLKSRLPQATVTIERRRPAPMLDNGYERKRFSRGEQASISPNTLRSRLSAGGVDTRNMSETDLAEAAMSARVVTLEPGELLLQEGAESAPYVYVAAGGKALHSTRSQGKDYFVAEGALVGIEPALSPDTPRLEAVRATKRVQVLVLRADKVQKLLRSAIHDPEKTMRYLGERR